MLTHLSSVYTGWRTVPPWVGPGWTGGWRAGRFPSPRARTGRRTGALQCGSVGSPAAPCWGQPSSLVDAALPWTHNQSIIPFFSHLFIQSINQPFKFFYPIINQLSNYQSSHQLPNQLIYQPINQTINHRSINHTL